MTITVLDNDRNPEGGYLPRSYTVQYWDAASGRLDRTESVQDRWIGVGGFDCCAVTPSRRPRPADYRCQLYAEQAQAARRQVTVVVRQYVPAYSVGEASSF